jgi:hypothetical protein
VGIHRQAAGLKRMGTVVRNMIVETIARNVYIETDSPGFLECPKNKFGIKALQ